MVLWPQAAMCHAEGSEAIEAGKRAPKPRSATTIPSCVLTADGAGCARCNGAMGVAVLSSAAISRAVG